MPHDYLNCSEAASHLGLSKSYLAKLRMDASPIKGPRFLRVGLRMIRYRRADLDAWMSNRAGDGSYNLKGR